jgi:ABC-type Fe3+/spermidine/putrescine transport system ATPase subunit
MILPLCWQDQTCVRGIHVSADISTNDICTIDGVIKNYGTFRALHGINLTVKEGEFVALVGPSGSGKSTLLQVISGFEAATEGTLIIDGEDMAGVAPADRPTSMVFQKLALFPHKTIAENIGFPLKLRKLPKAEIERRTLDMIALMQLKPEYLTRYPAQLSGGEQQRVALARSMISHPKLLLLDEPLSALDVKLKKVLQAELKRLHRSLGVTFIHVTHDLEEAMMLADHICVMKDGLLLQVGTPDDIYYRPTHKFVAEFIGETNLFPVSVENNGYVATDMAGIQGHSSFGPEVAVHPQAYLMVRPEFVHMVGSGEKLDVTLDVIVSETFNRGSTTQVKAVTKDGGHLMTLEIQGHIDAQIIVGAEIRVGWRDEDTHLFDRTTDTFQAAS